MKHPIRFHIHVHTHGADVSFVPAARSATTRGRPSPARAPASTRPVIHMYNDQTETSIFCCVVHDKPDESTTTHLERPQAIPGADCAAQRPVQQRAENAMCVCELDVDQSKSRSDTPPSLPIHVCIYLPCTLNVIRSRPQSHLMSLARVPGGTSTYTYQMPITRHVSLTMNGSIDRAPIPT